MSRSLAGEANLAGRVAGLERRIEIEEALERVRARTSTMRSSDELGEVAILVFEQIHGLGIETLRSGLGFVDAEAKSMDFWGVGDGLTINAMGVVKLDSHPYLIGMWEAWLRQESFSYEGEGDELEAYYQIIDESFYFPAPILESIYAKQTKEFGFAAMFKEGMLYAVFTEPQTEEVVDTYEHFARVFEQTYIRFLDLKKAEEQAREAQVEAGLEQLRSRAMAMYQSDELAAVAGVTFQQLLALGVLRETESFHFTIYDQVNEVSVQWTTEIGGTPISRSLEMPLSAFEPAEDTYRQWKAIEPQHRKGHVSLIEMDGQGVIDLIKLLSEHPTFRGELLTRQLAATRPKRLVFYDAWFSHGTLVAVCFEPLSEEAQRVLSRFAGVFEQSYIRFLDLKRAEEQAREAQIEASLERMRSRTMAMHRSDELQEVVAVIYQEIQHLGFDATHCNIMILDDATGAAEVYWNSGTEQEVNEPYLMPNLDHPYYQLLLEDWRNGVAFTVSEQSGDLLRSFAQLTFDLIDFGELHEAYREKTLAVEREYVSIAYMSHGCLNAVTPEPLTKNMSDVLQRMARVVELTYTRVFDLQQTEARAREAERQAALDRIRVEIASMRTAEDLQRVTPLIWRELKTLNVPFFRCGVFIIDEDNRTIQSFATSASGEHLAYLTLPFDDTSPTPEIVDSWRQNKVFTDQWGRQQFMEWTSPMLAQGNIASPEPNPDFEGPPESLFLHFVPFTQGMIYIGSDEALSEEHVSLVQSLADAFSVAYARYEDFQALEAKNTQLANTLHRLETTQAQLIQSEKMASLGQLTAGIAHEIKNPLNFVNNFSVLNKELLDELEERIAPANEEVRELIETLRTNESKIYEHGSRADRIVKSMMQHASGASGEKQSIPFNEFVEEYLNLFLHGSQVQQLEFEITVERDYGDGVGRINIHPREISSVLINLFNNALDAMEQRRAASNGGYAPLLGVETIKVEGAIQLRIADNGVGIPLDVQEKIFEPFFTTKPSGSGTGLGLSLSYDIVIQGHGGSIEVESRQGEGTVFSLTIPAD